MPSLSGNCNCITNKPNIVRFTPVEYLQPWISLFVGITLPKALPVGQGGGIRGQWIFLREGLHPWTEVRIHPSIHPSILYSNVEDRRSIIFIANACAVSHYISYSGIVTVLSTVPNTLVRECTEFFFRVSRFWITCLQSSRGSIILKVSTTSTGVLETLGHISFRTGYWEVRWRQIFRLAAHWISSVKHRRKMQKNSFFCCWAITRDFGIGTQTRVLPCESSGLEDSENVVELSLIGEAFSRNAFSDGGGT